MTIGSFTSSGQAYTGLYHDIDTRYNLCEPPPSLDVSGLVRVEKQARSVACLVEKNRLLEMRNNGSVQYSIQSPPVLTLAHQVEANCQPEYKKHCEANGIPYDDTQPQAFIGNFGDELCLGTGTAFLIGKQLILTAAHCICDSKGEVFSRIKLASLLVIFGFQKHSSGHVPSTFDQKDVYYIDAVWNCVYKKNVTDWAIVKLDREVEGRELLTFANSSNINTKTQLYMLGHPLGLPLKLTMGAEVKERQKRTEEIKEGDEPPLFEADLDAFAGNSGSPVFELERGTIVAMLFAGQTPKFQSDKKTIRVEQISKEKIKKEGFEKCLKIASINFIKIVFSSSFKTGHTHFVGRLSHLTKLKGHLSSSSSPTKVHILYGPGGVGKSELATTFAKQNIEDFSFIWSISCGSDEEQWVGYQGLAKRLEVYIDEKESLHSLILKVHRKLEQNESKPWLLLFDNLQKSPDFPTHPPLPGKGGSILITSYKSPKIHTLLAEAIETTEVLPLESGEALEFLKNVTEKTSEDCNSLLTQVGCYPLILEQVASYIKQNKVEVREYLAGLQKHQALLVNQRDPSKASGITLEATFNMTLEQLSPLAKEWLFLCSQLNAALIPTSYLKAWLHAKELSSEQPAIIAALEDHALLHYNALEDTFSLHLEFQKILRSLAPADTIPQVAHLLANVGNDWDFEDTNNWRETMKKATIWASHAKPIAETSVWKVPSLDCLDLIYLLDGLGRWEDKNACYGTALKYHFKAKNVRMTALGKTDPDVAMSLTVIGSCYQSLGNYNEALKAHGEALMIRKTFFRKDHSNIAGSLNNIGNCYHAQGNFSEALKMYNEAFNIYRLDFEKNHLNIAMSLNNIGTCYDAQGNYNDALKNHVEALEIRRAALGENHPSIASTFHNIGNCYDAQGDFSEALRWYNKAFETQKAAFGEEHPAVTTTLNNLGVCYSSQGNYNEALKMHGKALKIQRTALGDKHPEVAMSINNIANCYSSQGHYNKSLKWYKKGLEIQRATLGEKNPAIASSLSGIGSCFQFKGNFSKALEKYREALRIYKEMGENHPDVAASLNNIGNCYESQENYIDALVAHTEALRIKKIALKKNHPSLSASLNNIGNCFCSLGNYEEALKSFDDALMIQRAAFGEKHPDVAAILNNIGNCYCSLGNYEEALKSFDDALSVQRALLRINHPEVAPTLNNIASCYYIQGNYNEALNFFSQALEIRRKALGKNHPSVTRSMHSLKQCQERLRKI